MYWKRDPIIDELLLLNILNQDINNMSKNNILMKCQSITSNNYCNYIHKHGKNKDLICGVISKNKNNRCYTHSRKKNKYYDNSKIKLKIIKVTLKSDKNIDLKNEILIFKQLYNLSKCILFSNIYPIKENFFKSKILFIFPKYIYDIILDIFSIVENNQQNIKLINKKEDIPNTKLLEFNTGKFNNPNTSIKSVEIINSSPKKKNKKKMKKVIRINNNISTNNIKRKMEITLNTFEEKAPKDEIAATIYILFKENIELFKVYINIILSNIDMFFKDIDINTLSKIWNSNIEYIQYERVLIYSDNNYSNIVEKIFGYIRNNYRFIPEDVNILWLDHDKNIIVQYNKKYFIDLNKTGIKIYNNSDYKRQTPLTDDKLTILYY